MSNAHTTSAEKSPGDEKGSYEVHEAASPQPSEELARLPSAGSAKRTLPYGWQLAMIILTCLCTCEFVVSCSLDRVV